MRYVGMLNSICFLAVLSFTFVTGPSQSDAQRLSSNPFELTRQPLVQKNASGVAGSVVPLFDGTTVLEPPTTVDTPEALITHIGDRVRDRHAREDQFQAYDHYLSFYWEERTVSIEIIDRIAKGGSDITVNVHTLAPLGTRDFRVFFRGLNTEAEYFHNTGMIQAGTNEYTTTFSFNTKEGRQTQIGDRAEFEFSPFLQNPMNGRSNYYGTAFLYIVGSGIEPWEAQGAIQDSFPMPVEARLGGGTTLSYPYSDEPDHLFKQMATNMSPLNAQQFVLGRRLHHTNFDNGAHSEQPNPAFFAQAGKLGPKFIAESCVTCHQNNGRSFAPPVGQPLYTAVVRVGRDAAGNPHPKLGSVLQPNSTNGTQEGSVSIDSYTNIDGQYGEGGAFTLRKPNYVFSGITPSHFSVRMAPPLIGMGLIEAIDESSILALADPQDDDGDGISGRIQVTRDLETGELRLGRFSHKAKQPRVYDQIAAALTSDMGVVAADFRSPYDLNPQIDPFDRTTIELDHTALDQMTRYVALLGVNAQRNITDTDVVVGRLLFDAIGCAKCHTPSMTTSAFHPMTELREQTIQPFSDFLLHDMGPGLADNMGENGATGSEWRTTPLWNIGYTNAVGGQESYLHDGRARNLAEAILWHGGEGEAAKEAFRNLQANERESIIAFLQSL